MLGFGRSLAGSLSQVSSVRMTARACLAAALGLACVLACGAASAASSVRRHAAPAPRLAPMAFYVVKGAPDSCGRGCDRWIEAEGKIESGTAARFKAFLNGLHDRNLPIYFASPGGNLDQAIAMGDMLHGRPTIARVGRTLVRECGFEAQDGDVCVKLKQSGRSMVISSPAARSALRPVPMFSQALPSMRSPRMLFSAFTRPRSCLTFAAFR